MPQNFDFIKSCILYTLECSDFKGREIMKDLIPQETIEQRIF